MLLYFQIVKVLEHSTSIIFTLANRIQEQPIEEQFIPEENTIFEIGRFQRQELHNQQQEKPLIKREQQQPLSIAEQEILLKWFNSRRALCLCKRNNQKPDTEDMLGKTNENAWRGKRSMVCEKCWTNQQKGAKAWRGKRKVVGSGATPNGKVESGATVKRKVQVFEIPKWLQKYNIL